MFPPKMEYTKYSKERQNILLLLYLILYHKNAVSAADALCIYNSGNLKGILN